MAAEGVPLLTYFPKQQDFLAKGNIEPTPYIQGNILLETEPVTCYKRFRDRGRDLTLASENHCIEEGLHRITA